MARRSLIPALTDIVEASERLRAKLADVPLDVFEKDWEARWVVERGIEIVSEASRRLTAEMKARHPDIPWQKVAGIGNILRHDYDSVAAPVLWTLVRREIAALEEARRVELATEQARERKRQGS